MRNILKFSNLSFLILFGYSTFSQKSVIHIDDLKTNIPLHFLADVDGKVLIESDLFGEVMNSDKLDPIDVYPNWPISQNGASNRGGVYCNLDDEPNLEIIYNVGQKVFAWKMNGAEVPGWPVSISLPQYGAPAYGDIDGDGEGEIVVSGRNVTGSTGRVFAFEKDGSTVSGFPITLLGGPTKTPTLADLNGDNILEIIVAERDYPDGYVGAYYGDGSAFPGFPVMMDYIPGSAVAVGDITGDNIPEIIAESYYSIFAIDINGNILDGFPFTPGNDRVFSYSTPVLADLDNDGKREIIAGDHNLSGNGAIHILTYDGSIFPGWPKYTSYWIYGPPAVGDIDGDGNLDIAVGDQVLSGTPSNRVYVWDKDGNFLPGWPTTPINAINNQILLVDLDGDNQIELMWDDNSSAGIYLGYNHDGTVMDGWPLNVEGSTFFINPFVTDINNDGIMDLSGAGVDISSGDGNYYLWNVNETYDEELAILPVLQYNVQHDGVYRDASVLNAGFYASPPNLCEQEETQFTDQSTGDIVSWEWTFVGGYPDGSVEQNPIIWYGTSGEYDVTLTVSDGANSHTTVKTNYIHVDYEVVVPGQPEGPTDIVTSQTPFTFYETNSVNAENYTWELIPDNVGVIVETDTINKVKIFWDQSNSYSTELKVKGINDCGESDFSESLIIYVNWNTEINEKSLNDINVYPNPARDKVYIDLKDHNEKVEIILTNSTGEVVLSRMIENPQKETVELELERLPSGVYFGLIKRESEIRIFKLTKL